MNLAVDAIAAYLKRQAPAACAKVCYHTKAAAKKALRLHGFGIGCRTWYRCEALSHDDEEVYHLTSKRRFTRKL